jgi:hypothetical protein
MQTQGSAQRALRRLVTPRTSSGLESLEPETPDLSDDRIKTSLDTARDRFRQIVDRSAQAGSQLTAEQQQVLADAEEALQRLATEGETADLTDQQMIGLEAVIVPDGTRPALFVQDDDVNPLAVEAGTWKDSISALRDGIAAVAPSVGRINAEIGFPNYAGTGFLVAPDLVLTNRHVLEALTGGPDPQPNGTWRFLKPVTIDFAAEFERDRRRVFKVTGVAFASPDRIAGRLNPANLDVALLTVEANNGSEALPPPLQLSRRLKSLSPQSELYVMGYPARPRDEVGAVLMRVFQDEYFVKRFAPGFVEEGPDALDDGGHKRVFTHDSSTLGGNSGSCVLEFRLDGRHVVGLHFGGVKRAQNYAHSVARIEEVLVTHGAVLEDV